MRIRTHIRLCLLATALAINGAAAAQYTTAKPSTPPRLKDGRPIQNRLRLGYRGEVNQFIVITLQFKIDRHGNLDTLSISDNAPAPFVRAAQEQLASLNGQWEPQHVDGQPVDSKWLVYHVYIGGFREDSGECTRALQAQFHEAFRREEALFLCDKVMERPLKCLIDYVEGYDRFLLPPLLSQTVR